jgi:hypothetical protein
MDIDAATQAEAELKRVLSDDDLSSMHPAAQRLLNFVSFRLRPEERFRELSQILLEKGLGEDLETYLSDYTVLLDRSFRGEDDLTDWIFTFQAQEDDALDHAFERWKETSSLPWLVASLSKVDKGDHRMTELLEAASRIAPGSPAFPSFAFHSIRLMIQSGRKDEARETLDSILQDSRIILPRSALNLFLTQRMEVAGNLDEFLKYAPRTPAGLVYGNMWAKMPESYVANTPNQPVLLDVNSAVVLDKYMPLTLLKEICTQDSFPLHLRRDLAMAVWVRSVLLDNQEISQELAPVLAESAPELRECLNSYLSEKSGEARKFAAVFLILKHPGMHPFIGSGPGRETPLNKIDDYRYNWWGSFKPDSKDIYRSRQTGPYISHLVRAPVTGSSDFLNETQKSMAKDEWQRLSRLDTAPNYLCSQVINWAKRNPDDPRVPEALHLAVRSTRYGCVNEKTSSFSRQAFQLLHRQYPKSVWASKTKYWY